MVWIIEVKSSFDSNIFSKKNDGDRNAIEKILDNKKLINLSKAGKSIFAGIFAFNLEYSRLNTVSENLKTIFENNTTKLDCIAFDKNHFMKFWGAGLPYKDDEGCRLPHYSFYGFRDDLDFGFGYFISNIVEHLKIWLTHKPLDIYEIKRLYPLFGGKEQHKVDDFVVYESEGP